MDFVLDDCSKGTLQYKYAKSFQEVQLSSKHNILGWVLNDT
jgi:hypothetical protein